MIIPIIIGKLISMISRIFGIGSGGTWPGEVALMLDKKILSVCFARLSKGIIVIAGTNGKTTTCKMVQAILTQDSLHSGKTLSCVHNETGANLLNGLVSSFIKSSDWFGKSTFDWAVFEVDEATLPKVLDYLKSIQVKLKIIIVLLDLFRDQLDRYGEVDTIAAKWKKSLTMLTSDSIVLLNADDPQIAFLGNSLRTKVLYFGIDKPEKFLKNIEHATDSTYCRSCGGKLSYTGIYFSHLGIWYCPVCGNKRPKPDVNSSIYPLSGLYNEYNSLAATAVGYSLDIKKSIIHEALRVFSPVFGRQEEFLIDGKKAKIFLAKNPAGFNASLRTILEYNPKLLLFVLNDRIPDGRDVSWIYDVDFEMIPAEIHVIASGERVYDLAVRLKYALKRNELRIKLTVYENVSKAIYKGLEMIGNGETLYVLPTYSAMLEVRKILSGRKLI